MVILNKNTSYLCNCKSVLIAFMVFSLSIGILLHSFNLFKLTELIQYHQILWYILISSYFAHILYKYQNILHWYCFIAIALIFVHNSIQALAMFEEIDKQFFKTKAIIWYIKDYSILIFFEICCFILMEKYINKIKSKSINY